MFWLNSNKYKQNERNLGLRKKKNLGLQMQSRIFPGTGSCTRLSLKFGLQIQEASKRHCEELGTEPST